MMHKFCSTFTLIVPETCNDGVPSTADMFASAHDSEG